MEIDNGQVNYTIIIKSLMCLNGLTWSILKRVRCSASFRQRPQIQCLGLLTQILRLNTNALVGLAWWGSSFPLVSTGRFDSHSVFKLIYLCTKVSKNQV